MASTIHSTYFFTSEAGESFLRRQLDEPSAYSSPIASDITILGDQITTGNSSFVHPGDGSAIPVERLKLVGADSESRMIVDEPATIAENNSTTASTSTTVVTSRPRRVRTGCLTCRERHLKCDEAVPTCLNCKKSNRPCKRGVRLNFIDTQVQDPPLLPPTHDWSVQFQDESRDIASEYKGGLGRYTVLESDPGIDEEDDSQADTSTSIVGAPTMSHQPLPPIQSLPVDGMGQYHDVNHHMPDHNARDSRHHHSHSSTNSTYSTQTMPEPSHASYPTPDQHHPPQNETRDLLTSTEETLFMQVFVEEVGLWMDSMDAHKHVRIKTTPLPQQGLTGAVLTSVAIPCADQLYAPQCTTCLWLATSHPNQSPCLS